MAFEQRLYYRPGKYTLLRTDGKGYETHAKTRGRIWRGGDAWVKILRRDYGVDFRFRWVPNPEPGAIPVSVDREGQSLGNGYYATASWRSGTIWFLSFLANDPFRVPATLGRLLFHEWMHSRRLKLGGDGYGHAPGKADVFSPNCGLLLPHTLNWLLKTCGRIPGWKPPRTQSITAPDDPRIRCGIGVRL